MYSDAWIQLICLFQCIQTYYCFQWCIKSTVWVKLAALSSKVMLNLWPPLGDSKQHQSGINSLVSPESRNLERTEWMLSTHASFLFMVMDFCLTRSSTVNMNTWFYCAWFTNALIYWPVVISSLLYIINDNTMLLKQRGYVWLQFWKTVPTSLISPTMHKAGN